MCHSRGKNHPALYECFVVFVPIYIRLLFMHIYLNTIVVKQYTHRRYHVTIGSLPVLHRLNV